MQIQDIANSNILHANSNMNPSQRQLASDILLSDTIKHGTTPQNPKKMGLKLHETLTEVAALKYFYH